MSTSKANLRFQRLVKKYFPHSVLQQTWSLKGGISAQMTGLEIAGPDGQTRKVIVRRPGSGALRQYSRAAEVEFRLLQMMHGLGLATPEPYALDTSGEIFQQPYMVIEFIEGQPEFAPTGFAGMMQQMAAQLARIHSLDCAQPGFSFLSETAAGFEDHFGKRPTTANQVLNEGRVRDALQAAWPIPRRNPPALLHGDYWPGNLLWRAGRLAAVIDWEDAKLGDPLQDLAISRLDILWIFGCDAMETFTHEYLSQRAVDTTHLPEWDLYAALRLARMAGADLAGWAAFFPAFDRPDITEQTIRASVHWFITLALERRHARWTLSNAGPECATSPG